MWGRLGMWLWLWLSFNVAVSGVQLTRCRDDMGEMGIDKRSLIGRIPTSPLFTRSSPPIVRVRVVHQEVLVRENDKTRTRKDYIFGITLDSSASSASMHQDHHHHDRHCCDHGWWKFPVGLRSCRFPSVLAYLMIRASDDISKDITMRVSENRGK